MASVIATVDLGAGGSQWLKDMTAKRPMRDTDKGMKTDSRAPGTQDRPDIDDKTRAVRGRQEITETGAAKGGFIKKVDGKPKGKDHGTVPAQRGEFVMRTSAVKKYGTAKLAAVNAGKAVITVPKGAKRK